MATTRETKSPIKNLPVRMPGQSTRERIDTLLDDKVMPYLVGAMFILVLAALEWFNYLAKLPRSPWPYTVMALVMVPFSAWKIRAAIREGKNLKLGRTGEEAVGQFLEEKLRPVQCQILHDIPGDDFNVDHVVIGPTGVFSIETKTHSKPARGLSSVIFDGTKVTVNGFTPDRDPVVQAKAAARSISDLLAQSTGRRFTVQPVVLYPGWFVEKMPANTDTWVLNENVLPTFIANARGKLSPEDVAMVTFHLKRYVIAKTEELRKQK